MRGISGAIVLPLLLVTNATATVPASIDMASNVTGHSASDVIAAERFEFHSNFWLNLHHFLYITARAQAGLDANRPTVTSALRDTVGFGALSATDRRAWRSAIAYYDSTLARRDFVPGSGMVPIVNVLASMDSATTLGGSTLDPSLAAVLDQVAPVYRKLWWPRHDASNQRWLGSIRPLLAQYGDSLAEQESRAFEVPWPTTPVRVDISAYANWAGAYTSMGPLHITLSSRSIGNQGDQGLEILFHETTHTMDSKLLDALKAAFSAQSKPLPRDPTHVFIFYTAGELTQRLIPGHVPYAEKNGLWTRVPDFTRALPLLQQGWQAYLDGKLTFQNAVQQYAAKY